MSGQTKRFLVTGAGGFVGKALCRALRGLGHEVIGVVRRDDPDLLAMGVRLLRCDIRELTPDQVAGLGEIEALFHTAAKVEMFGAREEFVSVNVDATNHLLELCRVRSIPKFIYTSSPSVVADGRDLRGIDESYPYPAHYEALYPMTKAAAERAVLAANSATLWTVALRPHLIWGPGDTNLVPRILTRARAGRLVCVGRGTNLVDLTYIEDCVQAHVKAEHALTRNPACRGHAYFISQGEPVNLWRWIDAVLAAHTLGPVKRTLPAWAAIALGALCEVVEELSHHRFEPPLTRFLAREMATDHFFSIAAARRDLGYEPTCTINEAFQRTFGSLPSVALNPSGTS